MNRQLISADDSALLSVMLHHCLRKMLVMVNILH